MALEAFINGDKQKKTKKRGRTLRFELELSPPTEESTNEFSYTDLAEGEQRKGEGLPKVSGTLETGPGNQLEALARRLEEKYGAPAPKRKRQRVFDSDLIDRGRGYDTNDSFVDDSEMYEDFVPPQVDTKFGGFYVNTGNLEFKTVGQEGEEEMDILEKKKKKPKMKKQGSHQTPQSILASQKLKKAKQHVAAQKVPKPNASKVLFKTLSSLTSAPNSSPSPLTSKQPHKKLNSKKKDASAGPFAHKSLTSTTSVVSTGGGVAATLTGEMMKIEEGGEVGKKVGGVSEMPKLPPVLPDDLPGHIAATITQFEESVARDQASTPDGKMSVKTRCSYDQQLTELELACRKLPMKKRTAVLEYVSHKLGVSRATTIKRIRQVMKKREEEALVKPLQRLKDAVDTSMPEQLQLYEQELKARADSISASGDKPPATHTDTEDDIIVDEVFDESSSAAGEPKEAAGKIKRAPRKKYRWSDETRRLVCEVVKVKIESEEMMRGRSNGEEILMEFLESKVKPLWPKGWMQKSILYKTTESVHRHFTNPQSKKVVPSAKKVEKEKNVNPKREFQADTSSSLPTTSLSTPAASDTAKKREQSVPSPLPVPPADASSEEREKVQWTIKSAGSGSPITIVKKTQSPSASVGGSKTAAVGSAKDRVQITPRMAQLLSTVANSQALVKVSKAVSGSLGKGLPLSATSVSLHSEVHSLLSKFQTSQVKFITTQSPSVIVASGGTSSSAIQSHTPSLGGRGVISGAAGKVPGTKSKITTSPIQMKAIVSQLKPKALSHREPTVGTAPKQLLSSPYPQSVGTPGTVTSNSSSLVQTKTGLVTKMRKSPVSALTAASSRPLKMASSALSSALRQPPQQSKVVPSGIFPELSRQPPATTQTKRVSPPKKKSNSPTSQHSAVTSLRKPDSSSVIQSRVRSTSPYTNSHSSSSSSSSTSPQSHLPLSAIIQQVSPVLTPSPSPPPPPPAPAAASSGRVSPLVATSALSGLSLYSTTALEGTPITALLLQQQPVYAVTSRPLTQQHAGVAVATPSAPPSSYAPDTVTTIPYSSCASTFVLTSPFSQLPQHTLHQTPPPRSLAISPPTIPITSTQVLVGGASGTGGVKSPVERIYLEHSYGGKSDVTEVLNSDTISESTANTTAARKLI